MAAGKVRELSWSLSRGRMFEECPRRYYYHYYFAHAGYAPDAPEEAILALEMRRIKGLDMWVGEVVHQTIQWALEQARDGRTVSEQDAKTEVRHRLSDGWQKSAKQLWRTNPDDLHPSLFEHYYKIDVGPAVTDRLKNKAYLSVGNFVDSDIYKQIVATQADRWLPIEKYASFRLDGTLMYVKFDFAMRDGHQLLLYDWKTGKPSGEEMRQLTCYAMFAADKWHAPIENTKVCAVHLQPEIFVTEGAVGQDDIEELRLHVKQGFMGMVNCLRNPARNITAMEDFPMTGNLQRCVRCNFKGICPQGSQAWGEVDDLPIIDEWE